MINNEEQLPGETFEEETENDLHEIQADDDLNEPDPEQDEEGNETGRPDQHVLIEPTTDDDDE